MSFRQYMAAHFFKDQPLHLSQQHVFLFNDKQWYYNQLTVTCLINFWYVFQSILSTFLPLGRLTSTNFKLTIILFFAVDPTFQDSQGPATILVAQGTF